MSAQAGGLISAAGGLMVATLTLARGAREEAELSAALDALEGSTLSVMVADGGSSQSFVESLRRRPRFTVVPPDPGRLLGQVKASLRESRRAGAQWILYTEPDKRFFFEQRLRGFLERAEKANADLVLAARDAASMATFPPIQQATETALNRLCGAFAAIDADFSYGPFLVRAELTAALEDLDAGVGWGWRPFLFARTARTGGRLAAVVDDYPCPVEQRSEDDRDRLHRMAQLAQNLDGLGRALNASAAAPSESSPRR
jgi:hypothetical protein